MVNKINEQKKRNRERTDKINNKWNEGTNE